MSNQDCTKVQMPMVMLTIMLNHSPRHMMLLYFHCRMHQCRNNNNQISTVVHQFQCLLTANSHALHLQYKNTKITIAPSVDKGWILIWITVVDQGWLSRTKNEYQFIPFRVCHKASASYFKMLLFLTGYKLEKETGALYCGNQEPG